MNKVVKYITLCLTIMCLTFVNCIAQEVNLSSNDSYAQKTDDELYSYRYDGRSDPFKPFISPKTSSSSSDPNEIIEDDVEYSGMQLFEPGQLGLVGIMATSFGAVAMVEDQAKKGHLLKVGDLIGKRGVVTSIEDQQVTITETARTRSGKEMKEIVTMKMKGDK
jgi:Pilus assembly protein, PilP.